MGRGWGYSVRSKADSVGGDAESVGVRVASVGGRRNIINRFYG